MSLSIQIYLANKRKTDIAIFVVHAGTVLHVSYAMLDPAQVIRLACLPVHVAAAHRLV